MLKKKEEVMSDRSLPNKHKNNNKQQQENTANAALNH